MIDLKYFLFYKSYYAYDFEREELFITEGELHDKAQTLFNQIVQDRNLSEDDKWMLSIALDCIRDFSEKDIALIRKEGQIFDYHFSYGMYVRNRYAHPSKLHTNYMADDVSERVAEFIYAILLHDYRCCLRNT